MPISKLESVHTTGFGHLTTIRSRFKNKNVLIIEGMSELWSQYNDVHLSENVETLIKNFEMISNQSSEKSVENFRTNKIKKMRVLCNDKHSNFQHSNLSRPGELSTQLRYIMLVTLIF